ncbi:TetR/AcrR family transcriptional regulator [Thermodesulforhabdus norvegica]|uniref:Transcriptional regulator, TetR family n=1 Tax=Thermodesulforhabdus norvegica TaxID=39841 RepID=A0A1I4QPN6_9BACT|nr:TetR/AcrR family transcriptional regulator [Thermodesulforhabdus norvegica]SFM41991.1 transcriptional regulator, TetR family [Thermodesulforhabdus norvegica]
MTKKEIQAQNTRMSIIKSAVWHFARFGYHKTTVSEIARMAGVTTGALFHHFTTKEDLLYAVIEWLSKGIKAYADQLNRVKHPSSKTISDIIDLMCSHFNRYPEATICFATLATEFSGSHHPAEKVIKEVYEIFVEAMSRVLEHHPRVSNPRAASIAFIGAVQGIAVQGLMREDETDINTLAHGFLSMLSLW